ncbi:HepT-like ribonuclease domain-containing protein [Cellulomonas hominis]|uniref:HepT-like ribonuclease domain-containing protein n=1 Tax=Cellulomonas hominis TaxID=156981 RepID=UPI001BA1EB8D|nr:HepT-like ribonuclease domain-containing protein [Cellulomonas hominis]VTR77688.1 hypothetical protein CHMI_02460 [Cellulomonas hominis]
MQRDRLFVIEMIDSAARIVDLVGTDPVEALTADRTRLDAVLWNYTVLGEAAARLTEETRAAHPEIPWRLPAALRNRVVHGYWSIDVDVLHSTAVLELPRLADQLRAVRDALD